MASGGWHDVQQANAVELDLDMPGIGGVEVLYKIRRSPGTAGLPVVILTGNTEPETELKLLELGADDFIRKPFEVRRSTVRVKAALRRAGG